MSLDNQDFDDNCNDESIAEFEKISAERKLAVKEGEVPFWYISQGYMMFNRKYSYKGETVRESYVRISNHLAKYIPELPEAKDKFFNLLWTGQLSAATPAACNTGTNRGHTVSCSGGYVGDSVDDFYKVNREVALLSQEGYGTSCYLGDIRPRGSDISRGGKASGVVPVLDMFIGTSSKISQGNARRGQWAGYLDMDHGDFWEMMGYTLKNSAETNIGWNFTDKFTAKLMAGDKEAVSRWNRFLYVKARTGKGYMWKPDLANRLAPDPIKNCGITIKASNLCVEIALPQDENYTFSCVLSSLNLFNWDRFDDDTIFWAMIFLDCLVSDNIAQTEGKSGFENIHRFTRDFRAVGLGVMGWDSYLQSKMIPMESLEAKFLNTKIFKRIDEESRKASEFLAKLKGEPKFCKGYGVRNATRLAIAPTVSSSLLCGGVSQGIEPIISNTFTQQLSCGEVTRMNPELVKLLREKDIFSIQLMRDINVNHNGSVQWMDKLSDHEKAVFRTAYERDQFALIRLAEDRQPYIDQAQSLNTFHGTDENYIARLYKYALLSKNIKSLYYLRTQRNIKASTGECLACHA